MGDERLGAEPKELAQTMIGVASETTRESAR